MAEFEQLRSPVAKEEPTPIQEFLTPDAVSEEPADFEEQESTPVFKVVKDSN